LAVSLVATGVVASSAVAAKPAWQKVLLDAVYHDSIDSSRSCAVLSEAAAHLPPDPAAYFPGIGALVGAASQKCTQGFKQVRVGMTQERVAVLLGRAKSRDGCWLYPRGIQPSAYANEVKVCFARGRVSAIHPPGSTS
jgi:hypothetical protein